MITELKPLNLAEVKEIIKNSEEVKDLKNYLKTFGKLSKEKADKLAGEIRKLNNLKIKEEDIVKIIDILPKRSEEINKIFNDVSLDEKETNELLEIVKEY